MITAFLLACAALSLLCLAMEKYHRQIWPRPPSRATSAALRACGILLLCLSLWTNQRVAGGSIGLAAWLAELTLAMLLVMLALVMVRRR